jgi:UDPglucose 6-dehydrogenase
LSRYFGLPEVATYWEQVIGLNNWQQTRISRLLVQRLFGTVTGKRLAILGFAFKANTNDTRESPAIRISLDLLEEGAQLAIHDPKVTTSQIAADLGKAPSDPSLDLQSEGTWHSVNNVADAVQGADAVLILTEWDQYRELDWPILARRMRTPAWVFDTRSVVEPYQIAEAGLLLWRLGSGIDQGNL